MDKKDRENSREDDVRGERVTRLETSHCECGSSYVLLW